MFTITAVSKFDTVFELYQADAIKKTCDAIRQLVAMGFPIDQAIAHTEEYANKMVKEASQTLDAT